MNDIRFHGQSGKSLMEILIVLVIIAILVTIAVARFGRAGDNLKRQNVAREFKVDLERARFDSVKRRATVCSDMSRVTINSATSFSVTTDLNQNGTLQTAETRTVDFASRSDTRIVGNGVTLPITIRFDQRGHAFLSDCVSTPPPDVPLLYFCNGPCTVATANDQNANVLYVSPSGTVAMMPGNESLPTYGNANVSNVNSNVQINPELAVWDNSTPTPTPAPTATPTTPTPTPTPMPSPRYCSTTQPYERPADTGCICRLPQWVRGSGKCQ